MTQINCIGTMYGISGYDLHFRNLVNSLYKYNKVRISTQMPPNWERMTSDKELEMLKNKPEEDEINLIITSPIYWRLNAVAKRNWAYCIWEGDKVPKFFIKEMLNPDIEYILVASNHTKQAIINTIKEIENIVNLEAKIKIINHGVNLDLFYSKEKPKDKLTFLCNKGWRNNQDRGGTQYAIKAYLEEFNQTDKVRLIVKINPTYGIPNVIKLISELTDKKINLPEIIIDTFGYEYKDLVKLYNSANVFLAPTRAEAFGIPMIEAMACGLPVITSSFGGQTDFVNEDNGWLINGELTEVKHEIQYEGIKWLTPNIDELKKVMREIYVNQEIIDVKGSNGLKTALNMTWDESTKKIMELI